MIKKRFFYTLFGFSKKNHWKFSELKDLFQKMQLLEKNNNITFKEINSFVLKDKINFSIETNNKIKEFEKEADFITKYFLNKNFDNKKKIEIFYKFEKNEQEHIFQIFFNRLILLKFKIKEIQKNNNLNEDKLFQFCSLFLEIFDYLIFNISHNEKNEIYHINIMFNELVNLIKNNTNKNNVSKNNIIYLKIHILEILKNISYLYNNKKSNFFEFFNNDLLILIEFFIDNQYFNMPEIIKISEYLNYFKLENNLIIKTKNDENLIYKLWFKEKTREFLDLFENLPENEIKLIENNDKNLNYYQFKILNNKINNFSEFQINTKKPLFKNINEFFDIIISFQLESRKIDPNLIIFYIKQIFNDNIKENKLSKMDKKNIILNEFFKKMIKIFLIIFELNFSKKQLSEEQINFYSECFRFCIDVFKNQFNFILENQILCDFYQVFQKIRIIDLELLEFIEILMINQFHNLKLNDFLKIILFYVHCPNKLNAKRISNQISYYTKLNFK